MTLPTDIIYLIAQYLDRDRESLSHLARLGFDLYRALRPILFARVQVQTSGSLASFCDTICSNPLNLGYCVRTLRVNDKPGAAYPLFYPDGNALSDQLRATLLQMPHLRHLVLIMPRRRFNRCFRDLKIPFKLETLEIIFVNSATFKAFLSSQPSLKELRLPLLAEQHISNACDLLDLNILPQLTSITAPTRVAAHATSGRAVSEIFFGDRRSGPATAMQRYGDVALCRSTTPLLSVGIYHPSRCCRDPRCKDPLSKLLVSLCHNGMNKKIMKFTFVECPEVPTQSFLRYLLEYRFRHFRNGPNFPNLKRIDIVTMDRSSRFENSVLAWLRDLGKLEIWKKYVPSLDSASVYGVEIC
ncbi:hypothetical protein FRC08_010118 [Ceratobasidium sp. 394]|nr:hypothetical protein FRC08_010118 [Ceratobasidium sp. 394]